MPVDWVAGAAETERESASERSMRVFQHSAGGLTRKLSHHWCSAVSKSKLGGPMREFGFGAVPLLLAACGASFTLDGGSPAGGAAGGGGGGSSGGMSGGAAGGLGGGAAGGVGGGDGGGSCLPSNAGGAVFIGSWKVFVSSVKTTGDMGGRAGAD